MMRAKIVILAILLFAFPAFSQTVGGQWFELYDSGIDTLTGVASDSTLEEISLVKTVYLGVMSSIEMIPRAVLIATEVYDTISGNGEGVTDRNGFGDNGNNHNRNGIAGLDTVATAPDGEAFLETISLIDFPGNSMISSLKAYASAADTDSVGVRRWIYGLY